MASQTNKQKHPKSRVTSKPRTKLKPATTAEVLEICDKIIEDEADRWFALLQVEHFGATGFNPSTSKGKSILVGALQSAYSGDVKKIMDWEKANSHKLNHHDAHDMSIVRALLGKDTTPSP